MNKIQMILFAAPLVILPGTVTAQAAADETTGGNSATRAQPAADTGQVPAAAAQPAKAQAADTAQEPISGAFGIPLGEPFKPSMVAKVIDRKPQNYRGSDGEEHTGSLLQVEPTQPDKRFQRYSVKTTDKGVVYEIRGEYQFEREQAKEKQQQAAQAKALRETCKNAVIDFAKELETRHGKPRGKSMTAEWIAFRQRSDTSNRGVKVLGNRCQSGIYSVVYTDSAVNARPKDKQQEQATPASES